MADLKEVMEKHGVTVKSTFVPFSRSRNAGNKERTLNWKVSLMYNGRVVIETDYSAGIGHCPSYKQGKRMTTDYSKVIDYEVETGHTAIHRESMSWISKGKPIIPDAQSVVASLMLDTSVLDYRNYEEWGADLGYDPDRRKGEAIYRQCLEIALTIRGGLPHSVLEELKEAAQEY